MITITYITQLIFSGQDMHTQGSTTQCLSAVMWQYFSFRTTTQLANKKQYFENNLSILIFRKLPMPNLHLYWAWVFNDSMKKPLPTPPPPPPFSPYILPHPHPTPPQPHNKNMSHICPLYNIYTVLDGFFHYLVQMITSMRGCAARNDLRAWPISSKSFSCDVAYFIDEIHLWHKYNP